MYTDREYVKGHKLYLREMHFLLFVGISKELTMSEIAEKMNITQGAATQIAGRLLKKKLIEKRRILKINAILSSHFLLTAKMYISNT
ncbi:MAG: MarR family transcriptional regulator [Dorea formicigenerans]